jgi:hypothetical protein
MRAPPSFYAETVLPGGIADSKKGEYIGNRINSV